MAKLKDWIPFRFRRNEQESEQKVPVRRENGEQTVMTPFWSAEPTELFRRMDEMMRSMWREALPGGAEVDRWFGDYGRVFQPRVDVSDEGTHLQIMADIPGLGPNDVEITVGDGALVIKGERKTETTEQHEGYYHVERSYGSFRRVLPLPSDVDADQAEATFQNGVLKVRIPKRERVEAPRRVQIEART